MTTTVYPGLRTEHEDERPGLKLKRFFTTPGVTAYEVLDWEMRTASISDETGKTFFEQTDIEIPSGWSQTATQVVASKYFRGRINTPARETSARQMVDRIVLGITAWGREAADIDLATGVRSGTAYFASEEEAATFEEELRHILINQLACFNSPVWFNVGTKEKPQCSACFILSVEDDMESILDWCRTEGMIFKGGSGSGINLSKIRSSKEYLSGGGVASGPVSFMRGADAIAGSIKSGGTTRRAAKMVILNSDHPDVMEFIESKAKEERKAFDLGSAGWDMSLNGEAWASVQFQNANNSVRATDEFMRAAINGDEWKLVAVTDGDPIETVNAAEVLRAISQAAWECGDPGMQFDTTINDWHTCANTARINGSNPCSEYMHVDDSACNLSSINLLKFLKPDAEDATKLAFDVEAYCNTVDVMITAQEIIVGHSGYPTPKIEANAHAMRQLGLGYANLGALLMTLGLPYDSPAGRAYAAAVTSVMTGRAYARSANVAARVGAFAAYAENREPMLRVIAKHRAAAYDIERELLDDAGLAQAATAAWDEALELGEKHGYRNAQATVLAPTGTIAFMMDCDTTGVEPDIALIKYKKLVGGGLMKIVNQTVPKALGRLGYTPAQVQAITDHLDQEETIEGAPGLKPEDLPVFDCAFKPANGERSIHYMGHIRMMGAVQPFISGAISKTVNVPTEITVDEIVAAYTESWKLGVKAIAIYRDGSKRVQPLSTAKSNKKSAETEKTQVPLGTSPDKPQRRYLSDERHAITHKFSIAGHDGYVTVGLYDDGKPGEIFIVMSKEGTVISGLLDAFATAISLALQYGVPLEALVKKFSHMRFEPAGITSNPQIRFAQSILDYVFRWLAMKFLPKESQPEPPTTVTDLAAKEADVTQPQSTVRTTSDAPESRQAFQGEVDAPPCPDCGSMMVRSGNCHKCFNCGSTLGCS